MTTVAPGARLPRIPSPPTACRPNIERGIPATLPHIAATPDPMQLTGSRRRNTGIGSFSSFGSCGLSGFLYSQPQAERTEHCEFEFSLRADWRLQVVPCSCCFSATSQNTNDSIDNFLGDGLL